MTDQQGASLRAMRDQFKKQAPLPSSDDVKEVIDLTNDPRGRNTYTGASQKVRSYPCWYLNLPPKQLDAILLGFFVQQYEDEIERLDK